MKKFDLDEPERAWLEIWGKPRTPARLKAAAERADVGEAVVLGVMGWLTALKHDVPLAGGNAGWMKRARYREVLRQIGPPAPAGKSRTRDRNTVTALKPRSQRGAAKPQTLACLAVLGVLGAVCGPWVAALLTPIILDDVEQPLELELVAA